MKRKIRHIPFRIALFVFVLYTPLFYYVLKNTTGSSYEHASVIETLWAAVLVSLLESTITFLIFWLLIWLYLNSVASKQAAAAKVPSAIPGSIQGEIVTLDNLNVLQPNPSGHGTAHIGHSGYIHPGTGYYISNN